MNWLSKQNGFKGVHPEDVIVFNKEMTKAYSRGEEIPKDRIIQMKQEAEQFKNSFFWKDICDRDVRFTAQEYEMNRQDGEFPLGKGMIMTLNTIKKAIKDIEDFNIMK